MKKLYHYIKKTRYTWDI